MKNLVFTIFLIGFFLTTTCHGDRENHKTHKVEDTEVPFEWVHALSDNTENDFPISAVNDGIEIETTTVNYENEEVTNPSILDDDVDQTLRDDVAPLIGQKNHDLSHDYTPSYCRCVNKYYCVPNRDHSRKKRAINTPPCLNKDQVMCCLTRGPGCGVRDHFPDFNPYPLYGEASFAEYPWTAMVLDDKNRLIHGLGVVVSWKTVLTSARNVAPYVGKKDFKVRLGDWDLSKNDEPFEAKEFRVAQVIVHPDFNPQTFQNDIAVLKLAEPVDLTSFPNIRSACMIGRRDSYLFRGARCLVAGWGVEPSAHVKSGKITQGSRNYTIKQNQRNILKEVDLQIMDGNACQNSLRRHLGDRDFYLDQNSFLCAGGEYGKGLCKGDEGGALMCQEKPDSRFYMVGIASWATTCGQQDFPVVFTNMANFYDWVKSVDPNIGQ